MKLKTILIISVISLFVFLIYLSSIDKKVYFLSLGDSLAFGTTPYGGKDYGYNDYLKDYLKEKKLLEIYINEFVDGDIRTTDLIGIIDANEKKEINGKKISIKNALIKADLITISIGYNDLLYKLGLTSNIDVGFEKYIDEVMTDVSELLKKIRYYCKEDIIIIGYLYPYIYNDTEDVKTYFNYANEKLKNLSKQYNMMFLDVSNINKNQNYFPNFKSAFPNKKGHEEIFNEIKNLLNQSLFSKTTYKK